MNKLIKIENIDNEPRVDSRLIAMQLGNENKHTIEMIKRHQKRLEKYGKVPFQTAPSLKPGSYQKETVCYLNERQSTFLVTLSKNSVEAVELKQQLTDSYFHYREQQIPEIPKLPQNYKEALQDLISQVEKNENLQLKIETDKPKVELATRIEKSETTISVGDFAKVFSKDNFKIGRNKLYDKLVEFKLVYRDSQGRLRPYQKTIDAGWMKFHEYPHECIKTNGDKYERISYSTSITGKGQIHITKKLLKEAGLLPVAA
jgi:phage antirepressor YoqD-like protein